MKNISVIGLSLLVFACSDGTSNPAGAPDGAVSPGPTCSTAGTGTIDVAVNGLPAGAEAKIGFSGASTAFATASTTLTQPAGDYVVTAGRVAKADPVVRTLYHPIIGFEAFCLSGAQSVTVNYSDILSSNKLWVMNANNDSGHVLGFAGADLVATGSPAATVATKGVAGGAPGNAIAFDKDGNMWTLGATIADGPLLRFPASGLGASGTRTPDRKINLQLTGCSPALTALAFDSVGALWATNQCANQVVRIAPEALGASGDVAATDVATGVDAPRKIAFAKDGGMWVADASKLHHFSPSTRTPESSITPKTKDSAALAPDALAFDGSGNLWVTNFGSNAIYEVTAEELGGPSRELVPSIIITVPVGALLESLAFDENGGLWFTHTQGKIARLAPEQLRTSSTAGSPTIPATIVSSSSLGSAGTMAFFPGAAALPIFSSFH